MGRRTRLLTASQAADAELSCHQAKCVLARWQGWGWGGDGNKREHAHMTGGLVRVTKGQGMVPSVRMQQPGQDLLFFYFFWGGRGVC